MTELDFVQYRSGEPFDCDITACDVCNQNFYDDIRADREIRKFFRDDVEQVVICEQCLPEYKRC